MSSARKRSSHDCGSRFETGSAGFSLVELLIAMTMMVLCGAIALSVALQARNLYDSDAARIDLNQNLRSAMDMISTDARQTAERVSWDFPAVELVDNVAGDRLTLRRHLIESVLLSCTDLAIGDSQIYVGLPAGPGNCALAADMDTDGTPDNIQEYSEYRVQYGTGTSPIVLTNGFIYDTIADQGEYFTFQSEELDSGTGGWFLRLVGPGLALVYPSVNQPRVYVLDEARYDLTAGTLELRRNGVAGTPLAVVDGIVDFQVALLMNDSSTLTTFTNANNWTQIQTVQLQLAGARTVQGRTITRTLTSDVFPRNILSY